MRIIFGSFIKVLILQRKFNDIIFEYLKDKIQILIDSNDWKNVELAVLTLGAIFEGCSMAI